MTEKLEKLRRLSWLWILFLCLVLVFAVAASSCMGYIPLRLSDFLEIIFSKAGIGIMPEGMNPVLPVVLFEVRLPRIITSAVVGGGLSIAGTVFQGVLQNPLADPYTLGVSAGAAFGAAVAIILNILFSGSYSIQLFAFAGAVATLFFVIFLASGSGGFSSNNLILSGIIVAAVLAAGISFIKYMADEQVSVIIFWLMGSFASRTWVDAYTTAAFVGAGFCVCLFFSRDLNALALGEKTASSLGVDPAKTTLLLLITATLVTAACVSVSGIIGFVGLLVPHMMRFLTGPDNRRLIPASFFAGATLLLGADTITRAVLPYEIPIGILTALIGGPFFCYVFKKSQRVRSR